MSERNWIANMHMKKGALSKQLGIPEKKNISSSKLNAATHSKDKLLRKRAILAKTLKSFHKGK